MNDLGCGNRAGRNWHVFSSKYLHVYVRMSFIFNYSSSPKKFPHGERSKSKVSALSPNLMLNLDSCSNGQGFWWVSSYRFTRLGWNEWLTRSVPGYIQNDQKSLKKSKIPWGCFFLTMQPFIFAQTHGKCLNFALFFHFRVHNELARPWHWMG